MLLAEFSFSQILPWLSSIDTIISLAAAIFAFVTWLRTTEFIRANREARE
jgi:hypothetical protein